MVAIMASLMHEEIHQQPSVMDRQLRQTRQPIDELCEQLRRNDISLAVLAARGSSDNAARYAKYLLGAQNRILVSLATPSLVTRYGVVPDMSRALVMGVSQSGASPDIVAVVEAAARQQALTAALTVYPDSPLAGAADHTIPLLTGEERAVAATKTYTAELGALAALSARLSGDPQRWNQLIRVPGLMSEALLSDDSEYENAAEHLLQARSIAVVGRGFNYGTAMEIALKIQETSYVLAHPFSSADFRHGPLALVEPGFPVVFIDVAGDVRADLRDLATTVRQRGGRVLWITDAPADVAHDDPRQIVMTVPTCPEWLSPLVTVLAGQRLALALALARGLNPDAPRALHKVTETI